MGEEGMYAVRGGERERGRTSRGEGVLLQELGERGGVWGREELVLL